MAAWQDSPVRKIQVGPPHNKILKSLILFGGPLWLIFLVVWSHGLFLTGPAPLFLLLIGGFWALPYLCRVEESGRGITVVNVWRRRSFTWDDIREFKDTSTVWPQWGRVLVVVPKVGRRVIAYGVTVGWFPPSEEKAYRRVVAEFAQKLAEETVTPPPRPDLDARG